LTLRGTKSEISQQKTSVFGNCVPSAYVKNGDGWYGFNAAQTSAFMFTAIHLGRIRLTKVEHP